MTTHHPRYRKEADKIIYLKDGKIEEFKDELPLAESELENATPDGKTAGDVGVWRDPRELDESLTSGDVLLQQEEDRETGRVAFKVYKEYFLYGASAIVLFVIALVFFSGQGK